MSIVDVAFAEGDFVVRDGDFVLVLDNEAVIQAADLSLLLQLGLNQYSASAGWDWMRWLKASVTDSDLDLMASQIKEVVEGVSDVIRADVRIAERTDDDLSFDIDITTRYGTASLLYAIGGALVHR